MTIVNSIQDLCREPTAENPSNQVLNQKLCSLAMKMQEFNEAHSYVLESVRIVGGDKNEARTGDYYSLVKLLKYIQATYPQHSSSFLQQRFVFR